MIEARLFFLGGTHQLRFQSCHPVPFPQTRLMWRICACTPGETVPWGTGEFVRKAQMCLESTPSPGPWNKNNTHTHTHTFSAGSLPLRLEGAIFFLRASFGRSAGSPPSSPPSGASWWASAPSWPTRWTGRSPGSPGRVLGAESGKAGRGERATCSKSRVG